MNLKKNTLFTRADVGQIKALGLSLRDVERQLAVYAKGPSHLKLNRPCTLGDGILSVTPSQRKKLIALYEAEAVRHKMLKFVPASGAASRMFAQWFAAAEKGSFGSRASDKSFCRDLNKMPFVSLLEQHESASRHLQQKSVAGLLGHILTEEGLHYGWLPKALIHFHAYPEGETRTAIEEHLVEAASFIRDPRGRCYLHVTLSEEHIQIVKARIREVKKKYEDRFQVRVKVDHSVQSPSTNIIAVNEDLTPFRNGEGRLVFRPGGHGALLQNLGALDADFIFVKNIDNIVPDNLLKKILPYKKMLGGLALSLQQTVFAMLRKLEKTGVAAETIDASAQFCRESLNLVFAPGFERMTPAQKKKKLISVLNRPLRVCGMVRNEGEPGGGPFWVDEKDGTQTLQIVESAHVNMNDSGQQAVWRRAAYFNPVDMVCCIKNHSGGRFDLKKFVDPEGYLISSKTDKGRRLLAQELPGLWNGSMAYWNTVFVELPIAVFNPVKTVYDLLRPQHTAGRKKRVK